MEFDKTTKVSTTPVCNHCGTCCRNFSYIPVAHDDIKVLEKFTGMPSAEFTDNIDKAGEKRFMKFQENGDCIFLEIKNGAYSCSVYEARSATCRDFPVTEIQKEACRVWSGR